MVQEGFFHGKASCVSGQFSVGTHHTMTGNDDPDGIPIAGHAHGPGGFFVADGSGDVSVGPGFPIGDPGEFLPDRNLKGRAI